MFLRSESASAESARGFRPRFLSALIPLVVLGVFVTVLSLLMRLGLAGPAAVEPFPLLSVLNTMFMTAVSLVVAYVALRGYAATGLLNTLLLGAALIPSGVGALIAGLLIHTPGAANFSITAHNLGLFFSSLVHFAGALLINFRAHHMLRVRRRRLLACGTYLVAVSIMALVYRASRSGVLPEFFVPGQGGTQLRQIVLVVGMFLYLASGLLLIINSRGGSVGFLFWYALALFAMGAGLLPISLVTVIGGILSWSGRSLQYLAGVYFLIAVWNTVRTARFRGISLEQSIAGVIQESETFFRDMFDALSDAVIAVDQSGRVVLWNQATSSMFGYSRREAIGVRLSRLILRPEEGESDPEEIWKTGDGTRRRTRSRAETTFRRKSGELFAGELTHSRRDTAVGGIDTLIVRDVSERRRHEILRLEQPQDERDPFALFEALRVPAKRQAADQSARQRFREVLSGRAVRLFEAEARRGADAVELLVSAAPLHSKDGRVIGATAVLSDVTRLKRMEKQLRRRAGRLERLNAELEEFTYVSSHDLKEPLRALTSYLQMLQIDHRDKLSGEAAEIVEGAVSAAERMHRLIGDLLSYSRLGKGKRNVRPTSLQLVLDQVLLNFRNSMDESGARVQSGELPEVYADPTELAQLLQNLLSNSLKYRSQEAPWIRIRSQPGEDGMAVIAFQDNGIGIAERHHQRIFRTFQRLHSRSRYEGTGIGLAICKKVVEGYGGKIWVESEPGSGSTFCFTLPTEGEEDA
jgi:PAS domain S-box-containing protein